MELAVAARCMSDIDGTWIALVIHRAGEDVGFYFRDARKPCGPLVVVWSVFNAAGDRKCPDNFTTS
jgi:hypothetical protein